MHSGDGWSTELSARADVGGLTEETKGLVAQEGNVWQDRPQPLLFPRRQWLLALVPREFLVARGSPGERPPLTPRYQLSVLSSFCLAYFHH